MPTDAMPEGCRPVCSPVTASVWNIAVEPGQRVQAGQKLIVLEAMKMEIAVAAPSAGVDRSVELRHGRNGLGGPEAGDAAAGGMTCIVKSSSIWRRCASCTNPAQSDTVAT